MATPIGTMEGSKKIDGIEVYEIRNAADTLVRAEEIKRNKKLYSLASKYISEKMIADAAVRAEATKAAVKKEK